MKHNGYRLLCELLIDGPHPNVDMLVVKPTLYAYITNEKIPTVLKTGLTAANNEVPVYFTRVPQGLKQYEEFHSKFSPVKIMVSKLKKIKDQMIKIVSVNLPEYTKSLTEDDVKEIAKKGKLFADFFDRGEPLDRIPHAVVQTQNGVIPAFCLKVLTPEKRLVSDDIL